jgi:flagellar biosynthesis regulator FlaF
MYQFAYSEIFDEMHSQSIPKPRRLSDAIELIEAAAGVPSSSHELLGVLSDFRKLWLMIMEDFPPCGHDAHSDGLPWILGVADGVLQEIERCRFHRDTIAYAWRGKWPH